jgi:hypothetical protein
MIDQEFGQDFELCHLLLWIVAIYAISWCPVLAFTDCFYLVPMILLCFFIYDVLVSNVSDSASCCSWMLIVSRKIISHFSFNLQC